jgi:hypothetical protein
MRTIGITALLVCAVSLSCILGTPISGVAGGAPESLLYTSGYDSATGLNVVQVYDESEPSKGPIRTLEGLTASSNGMAVDAAGNLYVSQTDPNQPVVIFKPGHTRPSLTLSNPLATQQMTTNPMGAPTDVAVGADGTIYVSTSCVLVHTVGGALGAAGPNCGILIYRKGKTVPSALLTDHGLYPGSGPKAVYSLCGGFTSVAVDAKEDVYSTCNGGVIEFSAGSSKAVNTGMVAAAEWPVYNKEQPPDPGFDGGAFDVQIDSKGNIVALAGRLSGDALFVYAPGADRPSQIIPLHPLQSAQDYMRNRTSIRFDATMTHIFVNNWTGSSVAVDEYTYPGGQLVATFSKGMWKFGGLAVSPPAPAQP